RSTTRSTPPPPPPLAPPPNAAEVEEELNASDLLEDGEAVGDPLGLGVGKPPGTPVQNAPFQYGSDDDDPVILPQEGLTKHLQALSRHLRVVREALARHIGLLREDIDAIRSGKPPKNMVQFGVAVGLSVFLITLLIAGLASLIGGSSKDAAKAAAASSASAS